MKSVGANLCVVLLIGVIALGAGTCPCLVTFRHASCCARAQPAPPPKPSCQRCSTKQAPSPTKPAESQRGPDCGSDSDRAVPGATVQTPAPDLAAAAVGDFDIAPARTDCRTRSATAPLPATSLLADLVHQHCQLTT
jgi:hypothetical protein